MMKAPAVHVKEPADATWTAGEGRQLWALNYSGGRQSSWLVYKLLFGEIIVPGPRERVAILGANPGMEGSASLEYRRQLHQLARESGYLSQEVVGPNLYRDLLEIPSIIARARAAFAGSDAEWESYLDAIPRTPGKDGERKRLYLDRIGFIPRIDNPPFYTKKANGKRGQLRQKCTQYYKIASLNRGVRAVLLDRFGIKSPKPGAVERWIGFSAEETGRMEKTLANPQQKYIHLEFPIVRMGVGVGDIMRWFSRRGLPLPHRSVCNGCHSNGLRYQKELFQHYPQDWAQSVAVDEAVRDLRLFGIGEPVYVSDTLLPLRELEARGFDLGDPIANDLHSCNHGMCFI